MLRGFWAGLVGLPRTCLLSVKRRQDGTTLEWRISVSLPKAVPSTTLFSLSFVHHECATLSTLSTTGEVLPFTTSAAFALSITGNPLTWGTEGTAGATVFSTGFVTAASTDLKSSGTSDTASSVTAGVVPPLEAGESATPLTEGLVCGLKISFLRSGVGAVAGSRPEAEAVLELVGLACLCEERVGSPFRGRVKRSCRDVTVNSGCTSDPQKMQSLRRQPRKSGPWASSPTRDTRNAYRTYHQRCRK